MGTLYVVGTPIGNLEDMTPRAARVLGQVSLVAAEDTRVTRRLLSHLGIRVPLLSYNEHNQRERLPVLLEALASAGRAPIRMLAHSRYVVEALFNGNLRWAGQNRSGETSWLAAVLDQGIGSLIALGWSAFALWLQPMFFLWSLPVAVPLVLAAPLFVLFSRIGIGTWLRDRGLLLSPDEQRGNSLLEALEQPSSLSAIDERDAFIEAVIHPATQRLHVALAHPPRARRQQQELQLLRQRCLEQGPDQLTPAQRQLLAADANALSWLHQQVWQGSPDSPWGKLLQRRIAH